ncbi:pleiotropic drug resistance ABC transporter [Flammula alnicola]|nr:pleiotropic drug resistance ABC transporter [Flammula alnicola]
MDSHQDSTASGSAPTPEKSNDVEETFNFEGILHNIVNSRDEAGIEARELGVMFQDLRVVGLGATASHQETIGSAINPLNLVGYVKKVRHPPIRDLITGFEGVVCPGEMLLVLGRPGSGCSTLLKSLADRGEEYYAMHGEVHYDALTPADITKYFRGDVQYVPEDDIHFPTLTVAQTIRFAARMRAPRNRVGGESREEYEERVTEVLLSLFGLQHAKNTLVGDAVVHGVSGGEKKRVSICEAMACRARITAWDNTTRGLDASTALEYVKALRTATDIARLTTIVTLYQTGELLYNEFDKVCVIYEGKMAYFGSAKTARQYFFDLGYTPAHRQTTADFLVAVTDPHARIPSQVHPNVPVPRNAAEFAAAFLASETGKQNRAEVDAYREAFGLAGAGGNPEKRDAYVRSALAEHSKLARKGEPYLLSIPRQVRAVVRRRYQIFLSTLLVTGINLFVFTFEAIVVGTVFLNSPSTTAGFFPRSGVLYFALLFSALMSMSEIPSLFSQRPIVLRHRQWGMYHPFIEPVAHTVVDIPVTFTFMIIFGIIVYFLVGLQRTAGQFFIYFLIIFTMSLSMKAFFRALAAACAHEAAAQTLAGMAIFALALYTGYSIPQNSMIWALRWITYINPFKYGFDSLMTNEFHSLNGTCTTLVPRGPGYENVTLANQVCTTVGSLPGQPKVEGSRFVELSMGYTYNNLWRNFGIMVVFAIAFASALFLFTEINTKVSGLSMVVLYKRGTELDVAAPAEESPADIEKRADSIIGHPSLDSKADLHAPTDDEKHAESNGDASPDGTVNIGDSATTTDVEKTAEANGHSTSNGNDTSAGKPKTFAKTIGGDDVFTFEHIYYTLPPHAGEVKQLLDDVCGYVAPGKLTALMGESGAGKTTLLNALAERFEVGIVSGDRFINGHALPQDFQSQTGYCQQVDTHLPRATIREALLFSAKLRQPPSVPLSEKEGYVDLCLHMCGLWAQRNAIIGSLNVEFRKRTTIGVELAAKPRLLLFLDEPTSGLDSQSAWNIMAFLRSLANHGQAILCTIHQPSAELFHFFDKLLLLRKGGQTVYFGDLGHNATTLLHYFEKNGAHLCGPKENPAEYMLDIIGAGATAHSKEDWHTIWTNSPENETLRREIEEIHEEGRKHPAVATEFESEFATPWWTQLIELIKRGGSDYYRNSTYLLAKLVLNIYCGLFIGFSFFKREESQQGAQDKLFAVFMSIILSVPIAHQLQLPYIATRTVYEVRERPSRTYSWTALVTSQILVETPWNLLGSTLYFITWYWTCGFATDRAGYAYLLMGIVYPLYYTTIGEAIASMAPTAEIAGIVFGFLFSFILAFNGIMQPYSQLNWWRWMYFVSPYTYIIEGLSGEVIGHRTVTCSSIEFVHLNPPSGLTCGGYMANFISFAGGYLANPDASSDCQFCSMRSTDEFLGLTFNIFFHHRWRDMGILLAFILWNIATAYLFTYLFRIRTGSLFKKFKWPKRKSGTHSTEIKEHST